MGRDYSTLRSSFWTGDTGKRIRKRGDDAVVVALYLVSAPTANMIGLYYLPLPTLAHETGRPIEGALKALASLSEEGFAHYDEASETIWVPQMAYYQIGESLKASDNRCVSVLKQANEHRKSRYFSAFVERYWDAYSLPKQKPLGSPSEAPSDPLGSQEQEQDQEQEQERERSPAPPEPVHAPAPRQAPPVEKQLARPKPTKIGGRTWEYPDVASVKARWEDVGNPPLMVPTGFSERNWQKHIDAVGGLANALQAISGSRYLNKYLDPVQPRHAHRFTLEALLGVSRDNVPNLKLFHAALAALEKMEPAEPIEIDSRPALSLELSPEAAEARRKAKEDDGKRKLDEWNREKARRAANGDPV